MVILITGGNGDIGRVIVDEYIDHEHQVFSPSSLELDLSSDQSIKKKFKR